MEQNVVDERPHRVRTRFELAAARLAESWIAGGRMDVSQADMALATEFLVHSGWKVESLGAGRYRMVNRFGRAEELSREAAFMVALRRLAGRE